MRDSERNCNSRSNPFSFHVMIMMKMSVGIRGSEELFSLATEGQKHKQHTL